MTKTSELFPTLYPEDIYKPLSQYYDGTDWWRDDYTAAGNKVTMVGRFKKGPFAGTGTQTLMRCCDTANTESRGYVSTYGSSHATTTRRDTLRFLVQNSAGTLVCDFYTEADIWLDNEWHTYLAAYDGDTGEGVFFIDGVDVIDPTNAEHVDPVTGTLNTGTERMIIGNASTTSFYPLIGHLSYMGYGENYISDWTRFMDSQGNPKQIDEITWTEWDGVQPKAWNEHGHMGSNKGSSGIGTQNGIPPLSAAEYIVAGFDPTSQKVRETIKNKLNNFLQLDEAGTTTRVDQHGELVMADNGGTGVTQATGVNIGLATDFQNTTSDSAGVSNLVDAAGTHLELGQGSFAVCAWIEPRNLDNQHILVARTDNANASVDCWALQIDAADDAKMVVVVSNAEHEVTAGIIMDTSSTYFLMGYYNKYADWPTGGEVGISVNGAPFVTAAVPGGIDNDGSVVNFGRVGYVSNKKYYCGLMNRVGIFRAPLSLKETLWLYNNGLGRSYGEFFI